MKIQLVISILSKIIHSMEWSELQCRETALKVLVQELKDLLTTCLEENDLSGGSTILSPTSSVTEWSLLSYLGRVNYTYKDKYLFSVNGRVDGSSRFGGE